MGHINVSHVYEHWSCETLIAGRSRLNDPSLVTTFDENTITSRRVPVSWNGVLAFCAARSLHILLPAASRILCEGDAHNIAPDCTFVLVGIHVPTNDEEIVVIAS